MLGIGSSVTEFYSGFGGRFSPSRGYFIGYGTNEKKGGNVGRSDEKPLLC